MARNPEIDGYVSWTDVMQAWRWFEEGYGLRWRLEAECKCPRGELYDAMYYRFVPCDAEGAPVDCGFVPTVRFPNRAARTLPGALLGLAYQLDARLSERWLWAEPKMSAEPTRGRPKGK